MSLLSKIKDTLDRNANNTQSIIFELAPARLMLKNIYDYCLPAPYFNEYLSQIAQLQCWDKIYSGHQHYYYLNDMILAMNPDGKQSCYIPKLVEDFYWMHPDLLKNKGENIDNILTEVQKRLDYSVLSDKEVKLKTKKQQVSPLDERINYSDIDDYADDEISLKTNLRFRTIRQISINHNRFPPSDKYHFQERKVYRTYVNQDVTIHFEILRPIECQKNFEDLLLPKPESKFIIKIWIKDCKNLKKYLKWFETD